MFIKHFHKRRKKLETKKKNRNRNEKFRRFSHWLLIRLSPGTELAPCKIASSEKFGAIIDSLRVEIEEWHLSILYFEIWTQAHTTLLINMTALNNDVEDPYPSLSDYHDYEPNLEFDDTELQTSSTNGKFQFLKVRNTCFATSSWHWNSTIQLSWAIRKHHVTKCFVSFFFQIGQLEK